MKANPDGTYLLIPASSSANGATVLNLKNLGPIPVKNTKEAPGTNSQTPQMVLANMVKTSCLSSFFNSIVTIVNAILIWYTLRALLLKKMDKRYGHIWLT